VDAASLGALTAGAREGLVRPLLVGPPEEIAAGLAGIEGSEGLDLEIVPCSEPEESARRAVELCREGRGQVLLKGRVHTHELLRAVLDRDHGLRTGRLLSDVFLFEDPRPGTRPRMAGVTDGGITVAPTLEQKAAIARNAAFVFRRLGADPVRIAALAAVEVPTESQPHTLEARALAEMSERGEIEGAVVEGPLALDVALERRCAETKGLAGSRVAGGAHVLLAPTLEAGNILAKSVQYYSGAEPGHVVVGARVPIMLASRTESAKAKLHSLALALAVGTLEA
jgi:phosphotransacetylase